MTTFLYRGKKYECFDHSYNKTIKNERSIEIPIAKEFYSKFKPNEILEVGNVLSYYGIKPRHDCIDLKEGPIFEDWLKINLKMNKYSALISISTIEHMSDPIKALKKMLECCIKHLITFPLAYNSKLDDYIQEAGFYNLYVMRRKLDTNEWVEWHIADKYHYNLDIRGKYKPEYIAILDNS